MPRKTKEAIEEKNEKEKLISKKKVTKSTTKTAAKTKKEAPTTKTAKAKKEAPTTKAVKTKKEASATKATKSKQSTAKKSTAKKVTKTTVASKKVSTKSTKVAPPTNVEYYDLPYKYNQTIVKVLYQNPTTLFVYWEISDADIENYRKTYGDNFFETTKPVLVVYNDTMHYHFEIDINDFANSWYFNINDSKCDYRVELVRRPISYNEKITSDYIHITSSNEIESPNDKILFSTDEPYIVYFRNTKTNNQRKVDLRKLLEELNLTNKKFGFPLIKSIYDLYKTIYHVDDIDKFSMDLNNPSSGNPSSHSLSSRFI